MAPIWHLDDDDSAAHAAVSARAAMALMDVAVAPDSADALLRAVLSVVPVNFLSVVNYGQAVPSLMDGTASLEQERSVVTQCFNTYSRLAYFRRDAVLPLAAQLKHRNRKRDWVALHCRAVDLPDDGWRADIYERERLTDRFSLMFLNASGTAHAIHLYRDERCGAFQSQEVETLLGFAPLLRQAHAAASRSNAGHQGRQAQIEEGEKRLKNLAPALSPRECAVCARIAVGLTADGIAVDLDVAPSTVFTWRKRAYLKLNTAGLPAHRLGLARLLG